MSTSAIAFMVFAWGSVLLLTGWCTAKMLGGR